MTYFSVCVRFPGNPDHDQFAPIMKPHVFRANSLKLLVKDVRAFITNNQIGAGNFDPGPIWRDGKPYCRLNYNGSTD